MTNVFIPILDTNNLPTHFDVDLTNISGWALENCRIALSCIHIFRFHCKYELANFMQMSFLFVSCISSTLTKT